MQKVEVSVLSIYPAHVASPVCISGKSVEEVDKRNFILKAKNTAYFPYHVTSNLF